MPSDSIQDAARGTHVYAQQLRGFLFNIGKRLFDGLHAAGGMAMLLWQVGVELFQRPFYFRLLVAQLYSIGIQSLFLVLVSGVATGSVMALQFGLGMERFGGKLYIPTVVSLSILREMASVFTCLLLAGRVGSGMAAEIASMKVTQQIDAIRALGTSPIKKIVIPRILGCLIAFPLLTLFADFIGVLGAMFVGVTELGINTEFFISKSQEALRMYDVWSGMIKSTVFGFFIALTACWKGLHTEGGTEGVGNTTTWVVVTSSIFIMISDFFLTKLFWAFVYPRY